MRFAVLIILVLFISHSNITHAAEQADTQPWIPVAGQHYLAYASKTPRQSGIKYYFWPGSASCYQLENALQNWQIEHPEIDIERIPLVKRPQWRLFAKAWLVATALDKGEPFLNQLYKTIHVEAQQINQLAELDQLLTKLQIDKQDFATRYNSLAINQQLNSLQKQADSYPISGVPTIIINDRWYSDASMASTSAQIIEIIETLALSNP
jgi:thiol:disulfide interchange protein DsbA